jgi:hypothetical protein
LDINVRWMNNIAKRGYRSRLSDSVNVMLYPRLHRRSALDPFRLAMGLLHPP